MRLLAHLSLKRGSGGEWGSFPRAVFLHLKPAVGIYRRFKKEMKDGDYSGSLKSMVWLRVRTNSLNLGEHSWQRNREVCVGCSEERETLEHFILHCSRWEEWRIESRSLHRPRIEETDQVQVSCPPVQRTGK